MIMTPCDRILLKLDATSDQAWLESRLGSQPELSSIVVRLQFRGNDAADRRVERLLERAQRQDRSYMRGAELFRYCALLCSPPVDSKALLEEIRSYIPEAYLEHLLLSPYAGGQKVVHVVDQGYVLSAPIGIGIKHAWNLAGGDGAGMRFIDIEAGWNLNHNDLIDAGITLICGENVDMDGSAGHGTAVLGIVAAMDNHRAIRGIASGVPSVRVASPVDGTTMMSDLPFAITSAAHELRFGDVLLIEQHTNYGEPNWVPVESQPAVFEAIRLATATGVVVIEPAGNGRLDLDENGFSADHEDSGAIVVGAATSGVPHLRSTRSNYGSRIDCFAWGESIVTLGEPSLVYKFAPKRSTWGSYLMARKDLEDSPHELIFNFEDTSGAAAILAGVALSVQGLAQEHLRFRLSPWQLRLLLADPRNGTPSGEGERIGVMPDLEKIVKDVFSLTPDVYLRDHRGDNGEGANEPRFESPDIVVSTAVENPQREFGEDSGTEDNLIGLEIAAGCPYSIFVRARNRGSEDAGSVEARIYQAPAASLLSPALWHQVGATTFPVVPEGNLLTVSDAIPWQAPAEENGGEKLDIAWIALSGNGRERIPDPPGNLAEIERLLRSRQLVCRNFHLARHAPTMDEDDPSSYVRLPFFAPGAPDENLKMRLETVSRLPRQARVWLEMPHKIADLPGIWGDPPCEEAKDDVVYVPVNPNGRHYFRESLFPAGSEARLSLIVYVPQEMRNSSYQISVRQFYRDAAVGRVTWRLTPRRCPAATASSPPPRRCR